VLVQIFIDVPGVLKPIAIGFSGFPVTMLETMFISDKSLSPFRAMARCRIL
jgi:hypothetical protein